MNQAAESSAYAEVNPNTAGPVGRRGTSLFENGLIWLGAGISIAEIITGTYFAPLGFGRGLAAILLGHLIGCGLLILAGFIGGRTRRSAMDTVKMSFGNKGNILFALLNVIQLVGWTSIMIYDGALAADGVLAGFSRLWAPLIGLLIIVWLLIGLENLGKLNIVAMTALFALTVVLSVLIFRNRAGAAAPSAEALSFGAALELSVAMPLSWLPLISDYTREAAKPAQATVVSGLVYGLVSCWMYMIGMGAALLTGESDIAKIMLKSGLGMAALLIVILSTVTTTFLDAFSAGISAASISKRLHPKAVAIITTLLGTVAALLFPMDNISGFLYFIGSVFAPMIAVLIADYFILKKSAAHKAFDLPNLLVWLLGFLFYRFLMHVDSPVGSTIPSMLLTMLLAVGLHFIRTRPAGRRPQA